MRASEFIIEKVISMEVDFGYGPTKTMKLWVNPVLSELKSLVQRYTLRGLVWHKLFLVWDGHEAIHNDIATYVIQHKILDDKYNINNRYLSVVLSDNDNITDSFEEWEGEPEESNGIYYMSSYDDPTRMPSFSRSLKIR